MSGSKKYYWRKMLPQNPVSLSDGTQIFFEDMGSPGDVSYRLGYMEVDEDVHKELKKAVSSGLREGSKSEYDELKKKLLSEPLEKQWREEVTAPPMSPRQPITQTRSAAVDKEPAQKAIEAQSATEPLPEDSKPKVGKRPAAKEKDEA